MTFYAPFLLPSTLLDHLPADTLLVLDEPADIAAVQMERDEQARRGAPRSRAAARAAARHARAARRAGRSFRRRSTPTPQRLSLSRWATGEVERREAGAAVRLPFGPAAAYGGRLRVSGGGADADAARAVSRSSIVSTQSRRLSELLEEHDVFGNVTDALTRAEARTRRA